MRIAVRRDELLSDSINAVMSLGREDLRKIWRFEFMGEMGIDGFRMDAVPFIFEDPEFKDEPLSHQSDDPNDYNYLNHTYTFNLPEHYDMLGQFNDVISEFELIDGNDR